MSVIALLSDLGYNDTGVAKTKGILLERLPHTQLIDVTHNITPYYLQQAAYLLASSVNGLAENSFHVLLFDMYYAPEVKMLLAEWEGRKILAPDNGVLPLAFHGKEVSTRLCYTMNDKGSRTAWVTAVADVIARLQNNGTDGAGYTPYEANTAAGQFLPFITANSIEGHVIHIDNFGNVVLNITKEQFEQAAAGRSFTVNFVRENVTSISSHYNSVNKYDKLCRFNSNGYLEISINRGNAAELFGLKLKRPEQLVYTTIKIDFE
ncbi:MAG TPA: SAM-dependent chlorinase/fluorinase [Flavipsychrobacter sp.]